MAPFPPQINKQKQTGVEKNVKAWCRSLISLSNCPFASLSPGELQWDHWNQPTPVNKANINIRNIAKWSTLKEMQCRELLIAFDMGCIICVQTFKLFYSVQLKGNSFVDIRWPEALVDQHAWRGSSPTLPQWLREWLASQLAAGSEPTPIFAVASHCLVRQ